MVGLHERVNSRRGFTGRVPGALSRSGPFSAFEFAMFPVPHSSHAPPAPPRLRSLRQPLCALCVFLLGTKGPAPNADQISSAHPWNNPARSPFSSACGVKHGARGGRRHGDFPWRSFALPKTSLSRVWPAFFGCEVSSNKRSIQKLSVSPCLLPLRVWRRRPLPQGEILI